MARRADWLSVAISALVVLFLLDRWAEPEATRSPPPTHPMLMAPPPDGGGPRAALAPVSLPPPPARAEPPPEPGLVVRPLKVNPPPPPAPERMGEAKPRDTLAIEPLRPSPETGPPPTPEAAPVEAEPVVGSEVQVASSGRVLLRLLEHGSGPTVEIAWPSRAQERERLFERFLRCYGMTVAVMDNGNQLFVADGSPGQPWTINMDRYSGFVRQAKGLVTPSEGARVRAIKDRHPDLRRGQPVHVFPRATDAVLLGGLRRLVGEAYTGARAIRAVYRFGGRRLFVEDVRVEGEAVAGRIDLSGAARPNCA